MFDVHPDDVSITVRGDGRVLTDYAPNDSEIERQMEWVWQPAKEECPETAATRELQAISLSGVLAAGLVTGGAVAAVLMILRSC